MTALRGFGALLLGLVVRPLLRERMRTLLTLFGIAVGVSVLVAIQLSNASALRAFGESVDAISGRANFQIVSESAPLDERLLLQLQPIWDAGGRFAPVIDIEGVVLPSDTPIRILGVDLFSDLHFRDYRYAKIITRAGATESISKSGIAAYLELFRPDSLVLPEAFARQNGLDAGSRVVLNVNGRDAMLVVRGILRAEGPATAFNGSLGIVDIATAQKAFGMAGRLTRIDLLVPDESPRILAAIERVIPPNARVERPSRRNERVGKMLRAFRVNLFALAAVALLVGIFLVYNTVLISILRRRRDVGVFKTLGVSAGQIFAAFVCEGALFGFIGSAIGIALGYALAWSTLGLIGRTIDVLYVNTSPQSIALTPLLAAVAIAIGTGVSVAAAIQPALEAAALRPNALIRPGIYVGIVRGRGRKLVVAAIVALFASAAATRIPPVDGISTGGYAAVLLAVAGFAMLAPLTLTVTARWLRPLLRRTFSVVGDLAASSLPASLRRVAVATAALSISIGMMVAVAVMIGSFRETVKTWVDQTVQSDLWLRPARGLSNAQVTVFPKEIMDALRKIDSIAAIDGFRGRDMLFRDAIVTVGGGDFDAATGNDALPMVAPSSAGNAMREAVARDGVLVSESFSIKFSIGVGDTIELPTAAGVERFRVTGVYRDYSNDRGVIVMNRALYAKKFADDTINTVAIFLKEGVDPEAARVEIERRVGRRFRAFAFTNATIKREVMRIFDQTFLITYALLVVSILVAVLGIVNTLSALIMERRREIALLRVVGTSRSEVRLMIVLESAIVAIASTALGVLTGWLLSYILIFVINRQSFGWTIEFDAPALIVTGSVAITFAATVLAGLIPARLAAGFGLAEELKRE